MHTAHDKAPMKCPPAYSRMTAMSMNFIVRPAGPADAVGLLALIEGLALFEGWENAVDIAVEELSNRLGAPTPPITALVAENRASGGLIGMATLIPLPYSYSHRPALELEMLFVAAEARRLGVGSALLRAVVAHARENDCFRIDWNVLKGNAPARALYESVGGYANETWERWVLEP